MRERGGCNGQCIILDPDTMILPSRKQGSSQEGSVMPSVESLARLSIMFVKRLRGVYFSAHDIMRWRQCTGHLMRKGRCRPLDGKG